MKQTAVEWLVEQLNEHYPNHLNSIKAQINSKLHKLIEQAKEMEKAEKIKAQIEAVRAVDTYGLSHMLNHYEQQLKSE